MAWLKWPYFFQVLLICSCQKLAQLELLNGDASRTGKAGSAPGLEMASMAAPNVDYKMWCQSLQGELLCFFFKVTRLKSKNVCPQQLEDEWKDYKNLYTDTYTICILYVIEIRGLIMSHLFSSVCGCLTRRLPYSILQWFLSQCSYLTEKRCTHNSQSSPVMLHQHTIAFPSQAFLPLSMALATNILDW